MKTGQKLQRRRQFSDEFKLGIVSEYEIGTHTVAELSRLYRVNFQSIYRWIYQYSTYQKKGYVVVEKSSSSSKKLRELEQKVRDLEGLLGQKQVKLEYLDKLIELAESEYGISIKKNSDSQR